MITPIMITPTNGRLNNRSPTVAGYPTLVPRGPISYPLYAMRLENWQSIGFGYPHIQSSRVSLVE